jgi:steroid Delta-isomerase
MASDEVIRKTVQGYVDANTSGDRDAWIDLFSEDVAFEDPVGSEVIKGRDAMLSFWDATRKDFPAMSLKLVQVAVCGNEAAFVIHATIDPDGTPSVVRAMDVVQLDEDGRIRSLRAYWDALSTTSA